MSGRKTMLSRFHSRKSVPVSTRIFVKGLMIQASIGVHPHEYCLLYTSPSPRDATLSRMPSSA